jgi:hypothetical protein
VIESLSRSKPPPSPRKANEAATSPTTARAAKASTAPGVAPCREGGLGFSSMQRF